MTAPVARPVDFGSLRSIGVLRALQLGDMLCAVPALRALRRAAPRARITLIGLPWARAFASRFACYVDDFLAFPGYPGLPECEPDRTAIPGFLRQARTRHFELLLQMHGSGAVTNPLSALLGAAELAGFCPADSAALSGVGPEPGMEGPAAPPRFLPWSEAEHEVLRYLRLLRFLGIPTCDTALAFPLTDDDRYALRAAGCIPAPQSYACVHAGARMGSRRWPPERFALVADALARQGLTVVLTGTEGERELVRAVRGQMRESALDISGRTTLGALALLISQARVVVCNDTGVSHLAAALAAPSVVVCCGSDPRRWSPLDQRLHRVLHVEVACRPCTYAHCPVGHPCALDLSPNDVLDALSCLLNDTAPHAGRLQVRRDRAHCANEAHW